jgi:hypothetical protein
MTALCIRRGRPTNRLTLIMILPGDAVTTHSFCLRKPSTPVFSSSCAGSSTVSSPTNGEKRVTTHVNVSIVERSGAAPSVDH